MRSRAGGFALLETLLATTMLIVSVGALAQLMTASARMNAAARSTTVASLLAAQKLEQLRALAWSVGADGAPLVDAGLAASPPDALTRSVTGYSDIVDGYVRRWSIEPLSGSPDTALVLQVLVKRASAECRLVTLKTRRRAS